MSKTELVTQLLQVCVLIGVLATGVAGVFKRKQLVVLAHLCVFFSSAGLMFIVVQTSDVILAALISAAYMMYFLLALQAGGVIEVKVKGFRPQQVVESQGE